MTPPTDSLVAALRAVPCELCEMPETEHRGNTTPCVLWVPRVPALAAAAREWIKAQMPAPRADVPGYSRPWQNGYDSAVAEVARRLGL